MALSTKTDKHTATAQCRISCDLEILRHSPVFSGLNLDVVKLFAYLAAHRSYRTGDYLIEQGRNARQAFILVEGVVDITVHHRQQELLIQQLEKDTFFGELALLAQFKWFFNARAASDLEVLIIEQTAFQKVIEKFPEQKDKLIERIIQLRVDRLVSQTSSMLDRIIEAGAAPAAQII